MKEIDDLLHDLGDIPYAESGTQPWVSKLFEIFENIIKQLDLHHGRLKRLEIAKNDYACEIGGIKENSSLQAEAIMELQGQQVTTDKRITELEGQHNHKPIFERLTKLEFGRDNLMKRMNQQEAPSPLMLDLVQRVCALDGGSDYEPHSKCEGCKSEDFCRRWEHMDFGEGQPFCYREKDTPIPLRGCEGCADFPCGRVSDFIPRTYPSREPTCYRESHTCGECRHAHWNPSPVGLCVAIPNCEWESILRNGEACPNFEEKTNG